MAQKGKASTSAGPVDFLEQGVQQGLALAQAGRYAQAEGAFRQVLAVNPRQARALNGLGFVELATGHMEQAARLFQSAIEADPGFPSAHNNLGTALTRMGKPELGVACFQHALKVDPNYLEAMNNLGNGLRIIGDLDAATVVFERLVKRKPNHPTAYKDLALLYLMSNRNKEAEKAARNALAIDPKNFDALCTLGGALATDGRMDEGAEAYERAIAIHPDDSGVLLEFGNSCMMNGRAEQAKSLWRKALALNPEAFEAYRYLSRADKFKSRDAVVAEIEDKFADPALPEDGRMQLGFALGKIYEDMKDYPAALEKLIVANDIRHKSSTYSREKAEKLHNEIKSFFTKERMAALADHGVADDTPIFIVGLPRSGTTLTEQIIASHPRAFGAGELNDFQRATLPLRAVTGQYDFSLIEKAPGMVLKAVSDDYLKSLRMRSRKAERVTDKMPGNFMWAGLIKLAMPNAKVVLCRRDPLDNCLSIYKNYFSMGGIDFSYDFGDLGHYYRLYEDMIAHWREVMPGFLYEVQYEDMVADQERVSRELIAHLGLEWDDACLDFSKTERPVRTASVTQVRQGIYSSSVKLAERYGDALKPLIAAIEGTAD